MQKLWGRRYRYPDNMISAVLSEEYEEYPDYMRSKAEKMAEDSPETKPLIDMYKYHRSARREFGKSTPVNLRNRDTALCFMLYKMVKAGFLAEEDILNLDIKVLFPYEPTEFDRAPMRRRLRERGITTVGKALIFRESEMAVITGPCTAHKMAEHLKKMGLSFVPEISEFDKRLSKAGLTRTQYKEALNHGSMRFRETMKMHFEDGMTFQEIGVIYGISRQSVHQFIRKNLIRYGMA